MVLASHYWKVFFSKEFFCNAFFILTHAGMVDLTGVLYAPPHIDTQQSICVFSHSLYGGAKNKKKIYLKIISTRDCKKIFLKQKKTTLLLYWCIRNKQLGKVKNF